MTELRQALYALVDHPPVAPSDIAVVASRGARFVRRRRALRGAASLAAVVVAVAGFGLTRQSSDPGAYVATQGAGPPVSYTDFAEDAHGFTGNPSQPEFDILQVGWAPAPGGYSTSITVAGAARADGSYVSYGEFPSDVPGERCELYHFVTPGIIAFANAFCGTIDDGTRRFIGRLQGSEVTSTPTATGGTLLVATFDDSALPPLLESAGRLLSNVSAFTCGPENPECDATVDFANSNITYRV